MSERASRQQSVMLVERDRFVAMRDGVRLATDIFRPEDDRRYPALLAISPYGKGIQSLALPPQPPWAPWWNGAIEAGDPAFIVSRGYVHVIADVRGTCRSEGDYRGWMSRQEAEDCYDLIEWIAAQPWCDGNVGMAGISYFGTIQLAVAALDPPHLKAIMPFNAPADFYRECAYHGGMLETFFDALYSRFIGGGISVTLEGLDATEQRAISDRVKSANPDLRVYPHLYNIAENPVHLRDLHATMLHILGIDHNRFTHPFRGLDVRLSGVEPANVVHDIVI